MGALFTERAARAGAVVHSGIDDPCSALTAVLRRAGVARLVVAGGVDALAPWLRRAVMAAGVEMRRAQTRDDVLWADAGLSAASLAIADTGSVVPAAPTRLDRLVSMLTDVHIVLVPADALVRSLEDGAAFLRREARAARYLSFVTGPSRTGDIEMVLTVGVHGPAQLHHVLLPAASTTNGRARAGSVKRTRDDERETAPPSDEQAENGARTI
jgi:L-lactate dehydrogenase complex protein LldG